MNFIRDIIGEKRRMSDRPHDPTETDAEDRATGVAGDGASTVAQDRPAPYRLSDPLMAPDGAFAEPGTGSGADRGADEAATFETDDRATEAPSRAPHLPSRDRDIREELRSLFVAEREGGGDATDPLDDARSADDDDLWADFDPPGHAPLRKGIERLGTDHSGDDPAADDWHAPAIAAEPAPGPAPDPAAMAPPPSRTDPEPDRRPSLRVGPGLRIRPRQGGGPAHRPDRDEEMSDTPPRAERPVTRGYVAPPEIPQTVAVPRPAMGRGSARDGRAKTRLLGFSVDRDEDADPIASGRAARPAAQTSFPLGWLIVIAGPGRGAAFTLFHGVSKIGRGPDQTIPLDFGDSAISRENHAAIAYDQMQNRFYIGHGRKANLVRRNDRPVLATEELSPGDRITVGETVLRFVPLCDDSFSWQQREEEEWSHAGPL